MKNQRPAVVVDFDGTITTTDSSESLARRFAADGWETVHREYLAGRFGMRTWHRRMAPLLQATEDEMLEYLLPGLEMRPHFAAFCRYATGNGLRLVVCSDGLGFYLAPFLRAQGLDLELRANVFSSGQVLHPHGHPTCLVCGNCKAETVKELHRQYGRVVFIGDGFNDRFGSSHADAVLPLSGARLERHCLEHGLPHWAWRDFQDVQHWLEREVRYSGPRPLCPHP
ncbi:MAG TPA: hypothetical protein DCM14_09555, partial [Clostridiales bacterium UBA8153]|nr:hypothetical protein [Clostridiales bacterium UBA8153]